tara:strand:+ start:362 stop:1228 length:867 start_codon:yes stop_codon:yes gene_type:complete
VKQLVFTSAGHREFRDKDNNPLKNNNPIKEWTKGLKDFDVVTYCYDDSGIGKEYSDLWIHRPGFTKYQNFWHYASFYPQHLKQYDYIWVVDDDMFMSTEDINRMFEMMDSYSIDLGQPSMSLDGMHYVHILVNDPDYSLRYTNFVECSAPIFSRYAMEKVVRTFSETLTGWGWDSLISDMILEHENVAVFDNVKAYHAPSMSSINKVSARMNHKQEGTKLLEKYGKEGLLGRREVLSGYHVDGRYEEELKGHYLPTAKTRIVIDVELGDTVTWKPSIKEYPSYQWREV